MQARVIERTQNCEICDGQTDEQTVAQGKTMSPDPKAGRHK